MWQRLPGRAVSGLTLLSFAGHVLYPIYLLSRGGPRRAATRPAPAGSSTAVPPPAAAGGSWTWDDVDVLVPAFGEAGVLAGTVEHLAAAGVPRERITVVVDEDEATRDAALRLGCRVDHAPERRGKAAAVNRGVAGARSGVVVLLDANARVDGLDALVDRVVTGELDLASGVRAESGAEDESLYWRYENWIKRAESWTGGSLALVGEAVALRRDAFGPIPAGVHNDDLYLAFDFARRGLRVGVEPGCVAVEDSAPRADQLERRVRIMSGQLRLFWEFRASFLSGDERFTRFALHKVWRSTVGPAAQVALTAVCAARPRNPWNRAFLAAEALSVAAYLTGDRLRGPAAAPLRVLGQAVGMPVTVFCLALPRALRRPTSGVWKKRSR
ncbi:glycosyltransferase [Paenibacillus sp. TRM 82003]|uniref:glycosyltransferase n=1 Tax=Kineococcus sp. TRM81007 TaxID=2925831 RepID=UPI001F59525F|nr:glycosyltransferase [Kineococcus sp. TRM81007]MCI2238915.1 glycosyltransferase [Kineococcus sp. TRM81007]MCI3924322.1 glycosyltransferase [Paenibacillus sp. TRM 82003]